MPDRQESSTGDGHRAIRNELASCGVGSHRFKITSVLGQVRELTVSTA